MDPQLPLDSEREDGPRDSKRITLDVHPKLILDYLAKKLDGILEEDADIGSLSVVSQVIMGLGEFGLLDGGHFNVCLEAEKILAPEKRTYRRRSSTKVP